MNNYRRTLRAIQHELDAQVAKGELVIDRQFASDLVNWRFGGATADGLGEAGLLLACCRLLKLDLVCIPAAATASEAAILAPRPNDIGKFSDHGLFVFWLVDGAFQSGVTERGMMPVMTDLVRRPDEMTREIRRRSKQVVTSIARGVAAGSHGILIADDIAYCQGTLMHPEFVERCLLPVWKDQVKAAHHLGVPVFFHSDGNLKAVLPFIVEAGFDGLQCLEPAAGMDIGFIKTQHGEALCLMGNVDPALLHARGDGNAEGMSDLDQAVGEFMAAADGRGGLIFGTCSGLHTGMAPERVDYMYRQAAKRDPTATTQCC